MRLEKSVSLTINKEKLEALTPYKGKDGEYYNITVNLMDAPVNDFGQDAFVNQTLPKKDREAGEKGARVGMGKTTYSFNQYLNK